MPTFVPQDRVLIVKLLAIEVEEFGQKLSESGIETEMAVLCKTDHHEEDVVRTDTTLVALVKIGLFQQVLDDQHRFNESGPKIENILHVSGRDKASVVLS